MKICGGNKEQEPGEIPILISGNVYMVAADEPLRGHLYIYAGTANTLFSLETGRAWATGEGFCGTDFEDVTNYVCLDVSRLPPLEES